MYILQKVHNGGCYWLNVVHFSEADLEKYVNTTVSKQRSEAFFMLGLSVSKLLDLPSGIPVVRAFSQLMEEWEYFYSGATMQSVKFVMAKSSNSTFPQTVPLEGYTDISRPSIYKFNNFVVFEHLQTPHVSFEMDYGEIVHSLCDVLSKLYEKFLHEDCHA